MSLSSTDRERIWLILGILFCIGLFGWGVKEILDPPQDLGSIVFGGGLITVALVIGALVVRWYRT